MLDLGWLYAPPADLELLVGPSEERELAVRAPRGQVAGPVHAGAWDAAEGIRDEPRCGQTRAVAIAARNARAAETELADCTARDELERLVHQIRQDGLLQ